MTTILTDEQVNAVYQEWLHAPGHENEHDLIRRAARAALAAQPEPAARDKEEAFKAACRIHTDHLIMRYLMSNAHGRWDGYEKAMRHHELCEFYAAVFNKPDSYEVIHVATQALTDNLDTAIGFPLDSRPYYDVLAPLFFERFHSLAVDAARAATKPQGGA